ncbi:MAG: helix-turn-helix transcriptional regulator [Pseudomonadota bacterium]
MAGPTTRVLAVLELLQSQGQINGAELAQRLGVDRRTIRRYITVLEELGIPVTTEQGRYGGYRLVAGFKLPPMMFTDEETLAVALGLVAAQQLGLSASAPAIASVQAKLERVMPANLKRRVRGVSETTRVILPRGEQTRDDRALLILTAAAEALQQVTFVYHAPDREATWRTLDPYGLVFRQGRWYLIGFCHLRGAMRSFRLDRISGVGTLPQTFERPAGFDAGDYLSESLQSWGQTYDVSVVFHTDQQTAAAAFGFDSTCAERFEQQDDGLLLTTRTDSLQWFARWLSQLPFRFTVQQPEGLKTALRAHAQQLLEAC